MNENPNNKLITHLEAIAYYYGLLPDQESQQKHLAYIRAVKTLKQQKIPITTLKQAIKLPYIGKGIGEKIEEFINTGDTERLRELRAMFNDREPIIKLLTKIHGIGVVTANKLYDAGVRSLDDLSEVKLSRAQKIGLKYYKEFQVKIPRAEVTRISKIINKKLKSIPRAVGTIVGSYRRGEPESGDIDLLVVGEDVTVKQIVKSLKGFITDMLSEGPRIFMGVIEGGHRIDIRVFTPDEYPAALMYFTGSDQFDILMRQRAINMNMMLNEYGLYFNDGEKVDIRNEAEIFVALDMDYIAPEDRVRGMTHLPI
jgi:DNA polymerase/3'-5' exonuclease PolX